jgi:hypothetical protein
MMELFNIYCDESCHLEHDGQPFMVLGAVWCPAPAAASLSSRIQELKEESGFSARFEVKWSKVSQGGSDLYSRIVQLFFSERDLHFRALVAPKQGLNHEAFGQTHDEWYYKMWFDALKVLLSPHAKHRIFLDIKDSRGGRKVHKLREVLCNAMYDFSRNIVEEIRIIRSHESAMIQLADFFTGAVAYANRGLTTNVGKTKVIDALRAETGYSLTRSTLYAESKFNIFKWSPTEA